MYQMYGDWRTSLYKENVRRVQVIYGYTPYIIRECFNNSLNSRPSGKGPHDGKIHVYLGMKKNQFRQVFLNPWHMLISIQVGFGMWGPIFIPRDFSFPKVAATVKLVGKPFSESSARVEWDGRLYWFEFQSRELSVGLSFSQITLQQFIAPFLDAQVSPAPTHVRGP